MNGMSASYDSSSAIRNTQIFTIALNQPGVYVISGKKIQFNCKNGEIQRNFNELPPIGSWTRVEMKQEKEGSSYFITTSMYYAIRVVSFLRLPFLSFFIMSIFSLGRLHFFKLFSFLLLSSYLSFFF